MVAATAMIASTRVKPAWRRASMGLPSCLRSRLVQGQYGPCLTILRGGSDGVCRGCDVGDLELVVKARLARRRQVEAGVVERVGVLERVGAVGFLAVGDVHEELLRRS